MSVNAPAAESLSLSQTATAAPQSSSSTMRSSRRRTTSSDFDLRLMPNDKIFKRTLHPWSVHHSLTTSNWIATITRPEHHDQQKTRHVQFTFSSEREARKFCKSYAPPRFHNDPNCMLCTNNVPSHRHCRNCGVTVCERCSTRWGLKMVPRTYSNSAAVTVRVCKSCDWLSNAFCMSLLQGRYQDALQIHETGNVNLRTSFADIHREAMFPIHCAVMGGSLELVRWLVEGNCCPISVNSEPKTGRLLSVQTSASRTLLDLAMTGRPKVNILVYLVQKGLSIQDVKEPALVPKTFEAILKSGFPVQNIMTENVNLIDSYEESLTTTEDTCALCCERPMDCVLSPCGHQICCTECGEQLEACPCCKIKCNVLKIYKS